MNQTARSVVFMMKANYKERMWSHINRSCEEIIEEYGDLVYRIAIAQVKNKADAEDIFQEVFVSLIQNIHKLQDETHVKYWLIRGTINRSKNQFRSVWKKRVELVDAVETAAESVWEAAQIEEIRSIVQKLPTKLRTVVYLHYFEGFKVEVIAEIVKIPTGTVKSRLFTARKQLKNQLEGVQYE